MLASLNQHNRMKKLLFILALLAMVVLPNVAPAHEPGEHRQLSDGVDLVALEGRAGGDGEGMGVAELPAKKEATLASGDLRFQMHPRHGDFNSLKPRFNAPIPLQAITESQGSVPIGWCLPLAALLIFLRHPGKIGSMGFAVSPLQRENCHLYRERLSPFQGKVVTFAHLSPFSILSKTCVSI